MKPIILISANVNKSAKNRDQIALDFNYLQAINEAGGEPIVVTPFSDVQRLAELACGWMITGGADLPPILYTQDRHEKTELLESSRLTTEQSLFSNFAHTDKPILGICFGCQFLNVVHGGTLVQHMPDKLGHDRHTEGASTVVLENGSKLKAFGVPSEFDALCFHHQMVDVVAPNWNVAALDITDKTPEAIEEQSDRFRIGVQWHPERTLDSEASKTLFKAFIEACATQR